MWHVVSTAPNNETRVCKFLALHGFAGYAPEFQPSRRTRPGSVRDGRHHWIFPGYVFVQVPPEFTQWDVVRWLPGVRNVLQQDGRPAALDDALVDELVRRLAGLPAAHGAGFRSGQRVTIERGPLAMLDALFDRDLKAPDRVKILVYLLGRQVSVEIDPTILRAAG